MPGTERGWDLPPAQRDFFSLEAELEVNNRLKMDDIRALGEWAREKKLPNTSDTELVKFLHCSDYDVCLAQKCLETFHYYRVSCPEVFSERDVRLPHLQSILKVITLAILPRRTPDNYRIVFSGLQTPDTSNYIFADVCKVLSMTMDSIFLTEPTVKGVMAVFDMSNASMGHFLKFGFFLGRKITAYSEKGLPVMQHHNHFVNCSSFIDNAMKFMSTFSSKETMEKVVIHRSDNPSSILTRIPKECLPSDLGGTLPSVAELHDLNIKRLDDLRDYFCEEEAARMRQ